MDSRARENRPHGSEAGEGVRPPEGAYLDYAYTTEGSPLTITAPDTAGTYEIWYASDRVANESIAIVVN